jgi:hypothetical protein
MMANDQEGAVGCDPVIDLSRFKPEDFPTEDCDELARLERAREMREGVEPPPGKILLGVGCNIILKQHYIIL